MAAASHRISMEALQKYNRAYSTAVDNYGDSMSMYLDKTNYNLLLVLRNSA